MSTIDRFIALLMGAGVSLLSVAFSYFTHKKLGVIISAIVGAVLVALAFLTFSGLVRVPDLSNASKDEALSHLKHIRLVVDASSVAEVYDKTVEKGKVIPMSQAPVAGQLVERGTRASLSVSLGPQPVVTTSPVNKGKASCSKFADGLYRISLAGVSHLSKGQTLLVWVKPVSPSSELPGWYLQREPGNGLRYIAQDGAWEALAQVGNPQNEPKTGYLIDLAVSVIDSESATRMLDNTDLVTAPSPEGAYVEYLAGIVIEIK